MPALQRLQRGAAWSRTAPAASEAGHVPLDKSFVLAAILHPASNTTVQALPTLQLADLGRGVFQRLQDAHGSSAACFWP